MSHKVFPSLSPLKDTTLPLLLRYFTLSPKSVVVSPKRAVPSSAPRPSLQAPDLGNRQFLDMELTELFSVLLFAKAASACLSCKECKLWDWFNHVEPHDAWVISLFDVLGPLGTSGGDGGVSAARRGGIGRWRFGGGCKR